MLITLLVAAAVAAVAGIRTFPVRRYSWWLHWSRATFGWVVSVLLIVHAASATAVSLLADAAEWAPFEGRGAHLANGVIFGIVAAGMLRVDFGGFHAGKIGPPLSLLRGIVSFLEEGQDEGAEREIESYVLGLDKQTLVDQAWFFRHDVDPRDPSIPDATRREERAALKRHGKNLAHDAEALGYYRAFVAGRYKHHQRKRPTTP